MKIRPLYIFPMLILASIAFLGNKNGRATQANAGNTGAPGDIVIGGQSQTCQDCHNANTATVAIEVQDANGAVVTEYTPGADYKVIVTVTGTATQGYGFQLIGLKDDGDVDLDGFTDVGTNNYKIKSISNGRTYAEHDNVSTPNHFDVTWKAPATGTGSVTFYASGNACNKNGQSSGDGGGKAELTLLEKASATDNFAKEALQIRVNPNPISAEAQVSVLAEKSGVYRLMVRDLSGKTISNSLHYFSNGENKVVLPSENWHAGVLLLELVGEGTRATVKTVKI